MHSRKRKASTKVLGQEPVLCMKHRKMASVTEAVCKWENGGCKTGKVSIRRYWNWKWVCVHWSEGWSSNKGRLRVRVNLFSTCTEFSSVIPLALSGSWKHYHTASSSGKHHFILFPVKGFCSTGWDLFFLWIFKNIHFPII